MMMSTLSAEHPLDTYQKQGKSAAKAIHQKQGNLLEWSPHDLESITPKDFRGQTFDGENARRELKEMTYHPLENIEQNLDPAIIAVLENVENSGIHPLALPEDEILETTEKCYLEKTLAPVTLHHTLTVKVEHQPAIIESYKVCKGHSSDEKSRHPREHKHKREEEFASDPTIKSYYVEREEEGWGHRDHVICHWWHHDDTSVCDKYETKTKEVSPETWRETDIWTLDNPELLDSIQCTLVDTTKGNPETRIISGKEVTRPYWTKTQYLQCIQQIQKNCDFLQMKNCILVGENCLQKRGGECVLWEKIFKCTTRTKLDPPDFNNIYGTDPSLWETSYQPNQEFSDVATKLAVFDAMKKELQEGNTQDSKSVLFFKGDLKQCSKSIAEDIMYDCCFSMDGFTNQLKLSKCTSDELVLAESQRKGLTHYIGSKNASFLGLWTSRKEHIFCTFPSKLSRVFQEEARKQLNIGWGDAHHPDCRGLTQDEIKKLDFSKLNLQEAFELPKSADTDEKVKKIEERLKQRMGDLS